MGSVLKKFVSEVMEIIEDFAAALLGLVLFIFLAGQFFGKTYANSAIFWYPTYVLVGLLVIKLIKDILIKATRKK